MEEPMTTTTTTTTEQPMEETTVLVESTPEAVETFPNYHYKYEVHDEKTGDIKGQHETVENGQVKGQYSLIDSDGFRRIVDYTADDVNGFQATVRREQTHYKVPMFESKAEEVQQTTEETKLKDEMPAAAVEAMPQQMEQQDQMEPQVEQSELIKPYDFRYEVNDSHTGDIKRQHETAENGQIKGQYSLIDADGYHRIVEYTADAMNGFQAMVRREPSHYYQVPAESTPIIEQPQEVKAVEMPRNYIRWW